MTHDYGFAIPSEVGLWRPQSVEWIYGAVDLLPIWDDDPYEAMMAHWSPSGGGCYEIQVGVRDWHDYFLWEEPYVSIVSEDGPYGEDDYGLISADNPDVFALHLHAWHVGNDDEPPQFAEVDVHKLLTPQIGINPSSFGGTCVIGAHNLYRATHALFGLLDRGVYNERKMNR